jgi:hypothetical protein
VVVAGGRHQEPFFFDVDDYRSRENRGEERSR